MATYMAFHWKYVYKEDQIHKYLYPLRTSGLGLIAPLICACHYLLLLSTKNQHHPPKFQNQYLCVP